ncbi:MAG: hypothetical protein JHC33_09125 [Ignisphaera sp.]|nr:hypothetical protein [Ignisphaera sp.]
MAITQYNDAGTFRTTLNAQPTANRNIVLPDASGTLALVDSPTFNGTPTAPTAPAGTNNTQIATTAMVHSAITNDLNVTGSAPMYACRAWVNFNGNGTVAIRASGNVSSIVRNGIGDYTLNFATAMPDANYSVNGISIWTAGNTSNATVQLNNTTAQTANAVRISVVVVNGGFADLASINVAIFR